MIKWHCLFTDDFEKQTYNWTTRFFWQYPRQSDGFSALSAVLERDNLPHQQRLMLAKNVTKLVHRLHEKMVIQQDLKLEDIFVTEAPMVTTHAIYQVRYKNYLRVFVRSACK